MNMYMCSYCNETIFNEGHTELECRDNLLDKIEQKLKTICLYNLKRLYNFLLTLNLNICLRGNYFIYINNKCLLKK